jgi:hypothetical protein
MIIPTRGVGTRRMLVILSFQLLPATVCWSADKTREVWLSSLDLRCVQQSWGQPQADKSLDGHTLSLAGRVFTRGLATHAQSTLYVELGGQCALFTAFVGVEDALGRNQIGSVMFTVIADGRRLWDSGVIRAGQPALPVELDLSGVQTLGLLVGSADDGIDWDHAVWANACLHMLARASPRAVFPPPAAEEVKMLAALQHAHFAVPLALVVQVPETRLFRNGARAETPEWVYHCDVSMRQAFRCRVTLPYADPRVLAPFAEDAEFIAVSNDERQQLLDGAADVVRDLLGFPAPEDWSVEVKREVVFLRDPSGLLRKGPGRMLVYLWRANAASHYVQMVYDVFGRPVSFESRVATAVTERIAMRLLDVLEAGAAPPPTDDAPAIQFGTFFDPAERRFELTAYSYEGSPFLDPALRSNPFRPDQDPPGVETVDEYVTTEEYRSWCWYWWDLYGRVNGIRGNWNTPLRRWDNAGVAIRQHRSLEQYDAVDGSNQGDTQQLDEQFFQDLESCHAALFSGHGGTVQDRPQMSRGAKGWFAWGLGPQRLGAERLRHLLLEGCGVLSYFRDRPGRLLTQQWLKADFIDGVRTVSGADGEYIGNDRNGWRFFGRYHQGSSISDAWAFALIDECPDNAPVTVAYGATEQEALEALFDGRFSLEATVPLWSAASLWVSLRPRSELLPERPNGVYLSDLTPVSQHQDWGRFGVDMSVDGHVLTIGRELFDRGLGTHANAEIVYRIPTGGFTIFEALAGLDAEVADEQGQPREGGTIVFEVYLDGRRVYRSDVVRTSESPRLVSVPLERAREIGLVVNDAGDGIACDHADWALARLVP